MFFINISSDFWNVRFPVPLPVWIFGHSLWVIRYRFLPLYRINKLVKMIFFKALTCYNKNVEKTRNLSTCSVLNLVFVLFTGNKLEINWVYIHNALSWATCNAIKVKLTPRPSLVLFVLCSFFKHLKKLPKFQNFKIFFSFSLSLNQA